MSVQSFLASRGTVPWQRWTQQYPWKHHTQGQHLTCTTQAIFQLSSRRQSEVVWLAQGYAVSQVLGLHYTCSPFCPPSCQATGPRLYAWAAARQKPGYESTLRCKPSSHLERGNFCTPLASNNLGAPHCCFPIQSVLPQLCAAVPHAPKATQWGADSDYRQWRIASFKCGFRKRTQSTSEAKKSPLLSDFSTYEEMQQSCSFLFLGSPTLLQDTSDGHSPPNLLQPHQVSSCLKMKDYLTFLD